MDPGARPVYAEPQTVSVPLTTVKIAPEPKTVTKQELAPVVTAPMTVDKPVSLPAATPLIGPKLITDTNLPEVLAGKPLSLWERVRAGFAMPDLKSGLVSSKERFYSSRPDYMQRMAGRAGRYLYFILNEVENRGMPTEIALLPFVESAFNPQALSTAKASGMWQFIPGTGKHFGLRQTMFQDERRDVIESTRAALDYLSKLHAMFGDWHLALAAYNWGEGSVSRAIARNQRAGLATDYQSLRMPNETQQYVPKLQAIKNIIAAPEMFGIILPEIDNEQYFTTITKTRDIDVKTAARFAEMSIEEFKALNPSFNKPLIVGAMQPQIVLPVEKAEIFQRNLEQATEPLSSFTAHRVSSKDVLDTIASQYHTSADYLREINGIPKGVRLKVGTTVLVPRPSHMHKDIPESIAENAVLAFEPERPGTKRVAVRVRKGDTVQTLARRHRVTVAQLRHWNSLTGDKLPAGKSVFVHVTHSKARIQTAKKPVRTNSKIASKKTPGQNPVRVANR
jgi:membrane-bound lytic murein transglycosylase D